MATSTERARLARERKRNGVAQHRCTCGHIHYPSNAVAGTKDATPLQDSDGIPSRCDACTMARERLATAIARGNDLKRQLREYRAYGARLEAAHQQAQALLREHGIPFD